MDSNTSHDFHSSCILCIATTPEPSNLPLSSSSNNSASMGGCASRPKDLNGQALEEVPVEAAATTEVTNESVKVESTPQVAVEEAAEESKQEEASAEPKAEEAETETNGEANEDAAKDDGQKSDEGTAASAEDTKA